jgi:hypothetical protein
MTVHYKEYIIEVIDDMEYSLRSTDNLTHYDKEYFNSSMNEDRFYPTSKHGIRIKQDDKELASAIICEVGGATGIHKNSFLFTGNNMLICCCDKVYSLTLPDLEINWKKRLDWATCFEIVCFDDEFLVHGELSITRIDKDGNEKWRFGARDIFVTQDGSEAMIIHTDKIELRDWEGYTYILDKNGLITTQSM